MNVFEDADLYPRPVRARRDTGCGCGFCVGRRQWFRFRATGIEPDDWDFVTAWQRQDAYHAYLAGETDDDPYGDDD